MADEQPDAVATDRLVALAEHVLAAEAVPAGMELTLLLVDDATIAELNREHLGGDGPTDVLAFPIDTPTEAGGEVPAVLGDVVLCPAVARRQAEQSADGPADPAAEMDMLLVHGILHLLGHDHAEEGERSAMFHRTDELLAEFRSGDREAVRGPGADAGEGRS